MLTSSYARLAITKNEVNVRRANKILLKRKLRLASYVAAPILRNGFHNRIHCKSSPTV